MKEKSFVHNLSIESGFSEDELSDAKSILIDNQTAFFRKDYIGHTLRENEIEKWKNDMISRGIYGRSTLNDPIKAMIAADLDNNEEISWAISMNNEIND